VTATRQRAERECSEFCALAATSGTVRAVIVSERACGLLSLLVSLADVIPLLGDIVGAGAWLIALVFTLIVATAVIGLAWLFYRPLIAGLVIGGGIALVLGLRKIGKRQAQARGAALAPRPRPNAKARSRLLPPRAY
jgi:hypothetical protein